jgi:hypothetical protein
LFADSPRPSRLRRIRPIRSLHPTAGGPPQTGRPKPHAAKSCQ